MRARQAFPTRVRPVATRDDQVDARGASSGIVRVSRGGSWENTAAFCRSAHRYFADPSFRYVDLGFRLARSGVEPSGGSSTPAASAPQSEVSSLDVGSGIRIEFTRMNRKLSGLD